MEEIEMIEALIGIPDILFEVELTESMHKLLFRAWESKCHEFDKEIRKFIVI